MLSWVIPGQVAWDWWNDYNLTHVDFKAGMNTPTFKYYIDFAAANHAKYIILDGGWSEPVRPQQGQSRCGPGGDRRVRQEQEHRRDPVGFLVHHHPADARDLPQVCRNGGQGLEDRLYRPRRPAGGGDAPTRSPNWPREHKLLVDYHGVFKPTGLQRTYPNVVGYEGVYGLENFKWADTRRPALRRDRSPTRATWPGRWITPPAR